MFTLIVTVLAVLVAAGVLFRIADTATTGSGTTSTRSASNRVTASRALRPTNTPCLPLHPRDAR